MPSMSSDACSAGVSSNVSLSLSLPADFRDGDVFRSCFDDCLFIKPRGVDVSLLPAPPAAPPLLLPPSRIDADGGDEESALDEDDDNEDDDDDEDDEEEDDDGAAGAAPPEFVADEDLFGTIASALTSHTSSPLADDDDVFNEDVDINLLNQFIYDAEKRHKSNKGEQRLTKDYFIFAKENYFNKKKKREDKKTNI